MIRQKIKSKLVKKEMLNERIMFLTLENVEPIETPFIAGQIISVYVGDGKYRAFSICSAPSETRQLDLIAAVAHEGLASNYFKALELEDTVIYVGPAGRYKYSENPEKGLKMLATGTGIAPFLSIIHQIAQENPQKKIDLHWGVRDESELFLMDLLEEFTTKLPNFKYHLHFSQQSEDSDLATAGRVTKDLTSLIEEDSEYHLCGHPEMIEEVEIKLLELGVDQEDIFREKFTWAKV